MTKFNVSYQKQANANELEVLSRVGKTTSRFKPFYKAIYKTKVMKTQQ